MRKRNIVFYQRRPFNLFALIIFFSLVPPSLPIPSLSVKSHYHTVTLSLQNSKISTTPQFSLPTSINCFYTTTSQSFTSSSSTDLSDTNRKVARMSGRSSVFTSQDYISDHIWKASVN
ncbi:hypothetical protein EYC80_006300 [Monilinia laxa]|nr:hypothetical protein EYC80_006300 [Monilinia laxa]